MSLLDDIKAKADRNGDGRISKEDLESLKDGDNNGVVDKLKAVADQNDDGKLSFDDVRNFSFGDTFGEVKNNFFGK